MELPAPYNLLQERESKGEEESGGGEYPAGREQESRGHSLRHTHTDSLICRHTHELL